MARAKPYGSHPVRDHRNPVRNRTGFFIGPHATRPMMPFMSNTHVPHNRPRSRLPYFNTWAESIGNVPGKRLPQPSQGLVHGTSGSHDGRCRKDFIPLKRDLQPAGGHDSARTRLANPANLTGHLHSNIRLTIDISGRLTIPDF